MADAAQQAAAYSTVEDNYAPTDEAQAARNEAYNTIEEANWEDVGFMNIHHQFGERFIYNWIGIPRTVAWPARGKCTTTW